MRLGNQENFARFWQLNFSRDILFFMIFVNTLERIEEKQSTGIHGTFALIHVPWNAVFLLLLLLFIFTDNLTIRMETSVIRWN